MKPRGISIASVAARAGVSIATVSRVVNGVPNKASPETAARVRRAIAELGYRPMSAGRSLRQRQSRLVALIAANLSNPAMAAIAASAEQALRAAGLVMVLCDSHDRADLQDEYLLEMRAQLARATVLLGAVESPQLAAMLAAGEPLVFVNRRCPYGRDQPFIGINNRAAGLDVARHCLAREAADVALIHGHLRSSATRERLGGIRAALAEAGYTIPASRVFTDPQAEHLDIGYRAARSLVAAGELPAALICLSDMIAFGAHRGLAEAGRAGAGAPALIGFDDNPLNPWIAPWLSSVRIPYEAYGDALVRLVTAGEGLAPGEIILPHVLIARRETPGEPQAASARNSV